VVFCNFDGKEKHTVTVGDNAFIGSNSSLVAPLEIGDNAFVGAGSVITENVPKNALAIARARQAVKPDYNGGE
jgi:bifunctional UDP-N-acetylglucosamine pyrophosphorylase/glucosamine-1-phosphate N-acetyltransferase